MSTQPIKVLIVDDSALIRSLLTDIINSQTDMEVVGVAPDPLVAREKIKALNPDVLTLDVEMPRMDGLVFLEKLMRLRPMPVLMVSSLTEKSSFLTLRALELGAVDFVTKPKIDISRGMQEYAREITDKLRVAAKARVRQPPHVHLSVERKNTADAVLPMEHRTFSSTEKIIVIGASTGGTEALKSFLVAMPADSPGILITQHMPEAFTRTFAQRLNSLCRISVKEAEHGERILPGHAYVAPGNRHLLLARSGANYVVELSDGPPVSRHRPSVDVLFRSAANRAGRNAVGIIMTGMGDDGAAGMLEMREAGAYTFAQDEKSCVVFGMPKEAIARGGVDEVAPLGEMPRRLFGWLESQGNRAFRV
ncbi:response regulator receiver modulated CheB methylesterase [Geobacter metallireducens RCH3]|uniref:Protein-glutamate methylesterase/protein-glutamine glutaminase 1 n=1 Tax=Geobacter metallireducens (strain ATCC 53774 / DSM 7210 / GS-15) TaxID=269799 RepID=CHEB1_GEOMG|nr:chemotaxis response regulator protein-glutamate methylesterase [Geobacter metallireducens]Q39WQ9.1 RecName: Full=Protein-glutamate methylesterase/protein-glutamine glutaminase 1 [Geobacter metallireducens GS-15]ABB31315.1 protein glutamate methylesterase CheB associated with MCPs of class 36H, response receiver domain-containing [Geobacter metallireducens GS-15]EHP85641.1 response regulator receiver modulated CheB methylesterase [Geobacter metallireducens RCH3]